MKKIISVVAGAVFAFIALYFLTAPFMLDVLWNRQWEPNVKGNAYTMTASWEFYGPARAAITADWFGRDIYDGYCYKVCRMGLLMPMEIRTRDYE